MYTIKQIFPLAIVMSIIVGANVLQAAWSGPPGSAPTCPAGVPGCEVPINEGSSAQTKSGNLDISGASSVGSLAVSGVTLLDNNVTIDGSYIDFLFNSPQTIWRMRRNDGTGNWNVYWNTEGSNSATHLTGGHAMKQEWNSSNGIYEFQSSGVSGSAGDPITWEPVARIYPDGRFGAGQFCDVAGDNCFSPVEVADSPELPNCSEGDVLTYSGGAWVCGTVSGGSDPLCHKVYNLHSQPNPFLGGDIIHKQKTTYYSSDKNITHIALASSYDNDYQYTNLFDLQSMWNNTSGDSQGWGLFEGRTNSYVSGRPNPGTYSYLNVASIPDDTMYELVDTDINGFTQKIQITKNTADCS